jgi:hypothetical protein
MSAAPTRVVTLLAARTGMTHQSVGELVEAIEKEWLMRYDRSGSGADVRGALEAGLRHAEEEA